MHPQLLVRPDFKECEATIVYFPHSHWHSQVELPILSEPFLDITKSFPKYCPVKSSK
jgi:hypothetical protein